MKLILKKFNENYQKIILHWKNEYYNFFKFENKTFQWKNKAFWKEKKNAFWSRILSLNHKHCKKMNFK